jgi:hypothetical protein
MPNDLSSLFGGGYGDSLAQGQAPRAAGAPIQGPLSGLLKAYQATMANRPQGVPPQLMGPPGAVPMSPGAPPGAMPAPMGGPPAGMQIGPQGVSGQMPIPGGPPGLMAQGQMGLPQGRQMPPIGAGMAYGRRF